MHLLTAPTPDYRLRDSGGGRKLEVIAGHRVDRPCPQAIWRPRLPEAEWAAVDSVCERSADGGGRWQHHRDPGQPWFHWRHENLAIRMQLRFSSFGHCGVFFEQLALWERLADRIAAARQALGRAPRVVNLFAYTGGASLVMAAAGAEVIHVDSARGVLDWGRVNAEANGIDETALRFVHADAKAFCAIGAKRGLHYDGILADPPSWGHGKQKKEVWRIEEDLAALCELLQALTHPVDGWICLSSHTPGVQDIALVNCLAAAGRRISSGSFALAHDEPADERLLPAGIWALSEAASVQNGA